MFIRDQMMEYVPELSDGFLSAWILELDCLRADLFIKGS